MKNIKWNTTLYLTLSVLLTGIDYVSKRWAETVLAKTGFMPLIDGIIALRYAENTGAAFSVFSGSTVALSVFSMIVCAAVLVYMLRHPENGMLCNISLSMVLAGGTGNLIDRVSSGYVIDFFEFQFIDFAVFNIADVCITVGAALLFIALLRGGETNARMED